MLKTTQCPDANSKPESPGSSSPLWVWLVLSIGLHLALLLVPVADPRPALSVEPQAMMVVQLYEVAPLVPEPPPAEPTFPEPRQTIEPAAPVEEFLPEPGPVASEPIALEEASTPDPPVTQEPVSAPPVTPLIESEIAPTSEQSVEVEEPASADFEEPAAGEPEPVSESVELTTLVAETSTPEQPEEIFQEAVELENLVAAGSAEVTATEPVLLPAEAEPTELPLPVAEPALDEMVAEHSAVELPIEQPIPADGPQVAATTDAEPPNSTTPATEETAVPESASGEDLPGTPIPPQVLHQTEPVYPLRARRRGWSGEVTLTVQVLATGLVGQVQVERTSGYTILDEAAVEAVRSWLFAPAMRGSEPIDGEIPVIVRFTLE